MTSARPFPDTAPAPPAARRPRPRRPGRRAARPALALLPTVLSAALAVLPPARAAGAQELDANDKRAHKRDGVVNRISLSIAIATEVTTQAIRLGRRALTAYDSVRAYKETFWRTMRFQSGTELPPPAPVVASTASDADQVRDAVVVSRFSRDYFGTTFTPERSMALLAAQVIQEVEEAESEAVMLAARNRAALKAVHADGANALPTFWVDSGGAPAARGGFRFVSQVAWAHATRGLPGAVPLPSAGRQAVFAAFDTLQIVAAARDVVAGNVASCTVPAPIQAPPDVMNDRATTLSSTNGAVSVARDGQVSGAKGHLDAATALRTVERQQKRGFFWWVRVALGAMLLSLR